MRASFLTRIKRIIPSLTSIAPPRLDLSAEVDWQIVRDPTLNFKLGFEPETGKLVTTDQIQKTFNVSLVPLRDGLYLFRDDPRDFKNGYYYNASLSPLAIVTLEEIEGNGELLSLSMITSIPDVGIGLKIAEKELNLRTASQLYTEGGFGVEQWKTVLCEYLPAISRFVIKLGSPVRYAESFKLMVFNESSAQSAEVKIFYRIAYK
jgi:hypothetical protein